MSINYKQAFAHAETALAVSPSPSTHINAILCLVAIATLETGCGTAWKGSGRGSHNMGAIQYRTPAQLGLAPPYPPISPDGKGFLYTDTTPQPDGSSKPYSVYFRRYETPELGWQDLARVAYHINGRTSHVLAPAEAGNVLGVSTGLHRTGYYEGFGKTVADRIRHHYEAMMRSLRAITRALDVAMPDGSTPPPPTLRRGSTGEAVRDWQRVLGTLVADGQFGPATEAATKEWQAEHGLEPDGIVGPATWAAAERDAAGDTEPVPPPDDAVPALVFPGALRGDVERLKRMIEEARVQ